jgi:hypothetical protein
MAKQHTADGLRRLSTVSRAKRKARIVALLKSLPEATALGDAHLSLEVRGRRFGWLLDDHHGDGRLALNCRAESGRCERLQRLLADAYIMSAPRRLLSELDSPL